MPTMKEQAASLMQQDRGASDTAAPPEAKAMLERLFAGKNPGQKVTESDRKLKPGQRRGSKLQESAARPAVNSGQRLAKLASRRGELREDLVQQCAQSLVKDQVDAFLAIADKMSPEEIAVSLKTARQWRRPDEEWEDKFQSAPETGFGFIDQKPKAPQQTPEECLCTKTVDWMRKNKVPVAKTETAVRGMARNMRMELTTPILESVVAAVALGLGGP